LFSGNEFVSEVIRKVSKYQEGNPIVDKLYSTWSHCGFVITREFYNGKNMVDGEYYVWEITCTGRFAGDTTPDVLTNRCFFGVQIRKLTDVLKNYKGHVSIVNLSQDITAKKISETDDEYQDRMEGLKEKMKTFNAQYQDSNYQLNIFRLLASAIPCMRPIRFFFPFSSHWIMCSQFVALMYKEIGVFPPELVAENTIPQDILWDADKEVPRDTFQLPPIQIK
jgi:hypothetical protein